MMNKKIEVNKTCNCGEKFKFIPTTAIQNKHGYWWNCSCKSTLFKRVRS